MILFPSVKEMGQMKLDAMPEELLEFMGMSNMADLNNFITYYGMIYNIILIAISIFAVTFSSNLIYKEEKNKTIEYLNSLKVNRHEIYISKVLTATIAILIVVILGFIAAIICGLINGGSTFDLMKVTQIMKITSITPFVFMGITFLVNGITTRVSTPGVTSGIVLISYMLGYLSTLLKEKAEFLKYFSPFEVFSPTAAEELSNKNILQIFIYILLTILFIYIGKKFYEKRDLNI